MEAYADPLQYFEPDKPNDVKPEEVMTSSASSLFFSIKIPSYPAAHYLCLSLCFVTRIICEFCQGAGETEKERR